MRSKATRDDIKFELKQAKTKKDMMKKGETNKLTSLQARKMDASNNQDDPMKPQHKKGKSQPPFNCRHNLPGGPEIWAKPNQGGSATRPTQWVAAIDRNNAQYRLIEKHGRECDQ